VRSSAGTSFTDSHDEVHRVLGEKVFAGQAVVLAIGESIDGLS